MTLILCGTQKQIKLFREKLLKYNVNIMDSTCDQLDESLPVVLRVPEGDFFGRVTPERIVDVYKGHAFDLKLQTARLYDVNMEKYMSEPVYRKTVQAFYAYMDHIEKWDSEHIKLTLDEFVKTQKLAKEHIMNAVKMALVKTTRAPLLEDLLVAFGKEEVEQRLEDFSVNYKSRI